MSLEDLRKQYTLAGLDESSMDPNPLGQFHSWFDEIRRKVTDPDFEANAMALATANAQGRVANRIVLLKGCDERGFRFFTNYKSAKGLDLLVNPFAALLFYWPQLERQVRIEGTVEQTDREVSKKYFDSRPRMSRISAAASPQSQEVGDRRSLEELVKKAEIETENGEVKLPQNWGGFELQPLSYEFWQGRENRLHDRLQYQRENDRWKMRRLGP